MSFSSYGHHRFESSVASVAASLALLACGQSSDAPVASTSRDGWANGAPAATALVMVLDDDPVPERSDAAPMVRLERRSPEGVMPLEGRYVDVVEFRGGVAATTRRHALELVRGDGSRSLLVRELDGLPSVGDDGSLWYAARFGDVVEICRLTPGGQTQRLASFSGTATRLSPRLDGSVFFTGAASGGVVGIWQADTAGARCLTNCGLRSGKEWDNAYLPPPGETSSVELTNGQLRWRTATGQWQTAGSEARQ